MIVDFISDLHGHYPELEGGDLLIVAGDCTASDKIVQWGLFFKWLKKQNYRKKILIGGNHDNFLMKGWPKNQKEADDLKEVKDSLHEEIDFEYLCDSGTEFEAQKIWGSPWTKTFGGMNSNCKAFTCDTEEELAEKWALIPDDTDILITHGPQYGILDTVFREYELNARRDHLFDFCGSSSLADRVEKLRPKVFVFGHIHEHGGKIESIGNTKYINCSHVDRNYQPVNKPIRIVL